jgi:RNA polymerase sigma-70 factor (ECF subfamily)
VSSADSVRRRPALTARVLEAGVHGDAEPRTGASAPETVSTDIRTLFDAHYASIWRLLRRLGVQPSQVDDAAQEVFWVAARRLSDIQPGREHAFLYGVSLRVASNTVRRQNAAPPLAELERVSLVPDERPSPEEHLEQQRARALLDAVLDRMPLELRTVFVLFELEGLEVRDIAALEEIPVGTASSRLRRAREEFSALAKRVHAMIAARRGSH